MAKLMKGHKWRDKKHKMTYPAWVEIKTDEIRCEVKVHSDGCVQYLSYAEKPLANMQQFDQFFRELSLESGYAVFDCGFEVNQNFNDSYRWVRSTKGLPPELVSASTRFILFDLPEMLDVPFERRSVERHRTMVCGVGIEGAVLHLPVGKFAEDADAVDRLFVSVRAAGHEGVMVKSMQHLYEPGKRSNGWLKVKPEEDADGVIVELIEAVSDTDDASKGLYKGKRLGRIGSIRVAVDDGSEAVPHGIDHDLGIDMYEHPEKYLQQWCEFAYMERDRQGGYRHPVFRRLREAKA